MSQLLRTKSIDELISETQVEGKRLKRSLDPDCVWNRRGDRRRYFYCDRNGCGGTALQYSLGFECALARSPAEWRKRRFGCRQAWSWAWFDAFVSPGRYYLRLCGALLCRACVDDSDCRQCIHLRLYCARGNFRLDHWLGSDSRICCVEYVGCGRVFGLLQCNV